MEKRILNYRKYIDKLLLEGCDDWNEVMSDHLIQISFFQHERLIHLIVTVLFALMEIISMVSTVVIGNIGLILLDVLLLMLLIPYIRHYYILENEVQKMYFQYDRIREKAGCNNVFSYNNSKKDVR